MPNSLFWKLRYKRNVQRLVVPTHTLCFVHFLITHLSYFTIDTLYFALFQCNLRYRPYDPLIDLTDTIFSLTVMLKMNAFPSHDGSSTLQVIWKVQARCMIGSRIIPVCSFMITGWPHNSRPQRMGISWL